MEPADTPSDRPADTGQESDPRGFQPGRTPRDERRRRHDQILERAHAPAGASGPGRCGTRRNGGLHPRRPLPRGRQRRRDGTTVGSAHASRSHARPAGPGRRRRQGGLQSRRAHSRRRVRRQGDALGRADREAARATSARRIGFGRDVHRAVLRRVQPRREDVRDVRGDADLPLEQSAATSLSAGSTRTRATSPSAPTERPSRAAASAAPERCGCGTCARTAR